MQSLQTPLLAFWQPFPDFGNKARHPHTQLNAPNAVSQYKIAITSNVLSRSLETLPAFRQQSPTYRRATPYTIKTPKRGFAEQNSIQNDRQRLKKHFLPRRLPGASERCPRRRISDGP